MPKYAIIDVETTGGQPRYERVTEIAIVVHDGAKVVETFSTLLNPERSIPWNITNITGITDDMVANAPKFYEVAKKIVQLTDDAIFVAHNASFDYNFIREEFARLGYSYVRKQLCTVRLARKAFPGLHSYSLSNLKAHFGIRAERSHRALDDTLATVNIFERILATQQDEPALPELIHKTILEARLPQNITIARLKALPATCGVYYMHDEEGKVVYVGKSLNIQKRMFEHFADQTPKGEKMRLGVHDISHVVTGSELTALLLESAEIKRLQPRINRAQRAKTHLGGVYTYTDQRGYQCLAVGKRSTKAAKNLTAVATYQKVEHARSHLESIARQFELCKKLCNLDLHEHACFYYAIKKCAGACVGEEPATDYNSRVEQALTVLQRCISGNFLVIEPGRQPGEYAVVGVRDGHCLGYGYIDADEAAPDAETLLNSLQPFGKDPEAGRIIDGYMTAKKSIKIVRY
jgi:DNA polymerase III subunit epsilon